MSHLSAQAFVLILFLAVACSSVATSHARAEDAKPAAGATPPLADPSLLLVRDDAVRQELKVTPAQREQLDALLSAHNRLLIAIRDVGPNGADETAQPAIAELRTGLKQLFTTEQKFRLQGLILQAQGYDALLRKDIIAKLKISPEQQTTLAAIAAETRDQVQALNQERETHSPEELKQGLADIQAARLKRIIAELDDRQESIYAKLLGEAFDFSQVKPSPGMAPEFASIDAWINSEPITIESLRGKVVVVHFFAFGCINCIHNYPWYKEWHDAYQGKDVALIGIHTPETTTEEDNSLLEASLEKNGLKFPVAVDKEKAMWKAWYNNIWPSVYIIDKQGRLRFWWYGELDWEGAGNQEVARQQIEQLLAE